MGAFRAIGRDALLALGMREMTFGWNVEMQARAARRGLRVLEIPTPYGLRLGGKSKVAGSLKRHAEGQRQHRRDARAGCCESRRRRPRPSEAMRQRQCEGLASPILILSSGEIGAAPLA